MEWGVGWGGETGRPGLGGEGEGASEAVPLCILLLYQVWVQQLGLCL